MTSLVYAVVLCTSLGGGDPLICEPVLIFDDYPSCNAQATGNNMRLAASGISKEVRREAGNPRWICRTRIVRE